MKNNLLQSKQWQKLQQDLGKTAFFEEKEDFSYLATLETTPIGNYLYVPYGPCSESQKGFKNAIKSLQELAKSKNAIFIRIEPQDPQNAQILRNMKAKKSHDLNPADTWILDLSGSDEELKAKIPSRLFRYYKNREKNNIHIKTSDNPDDIHFLVELQSKLAKTKRINIFSEKYLKTELKQKFATLYLVKQEAKVIAAGLVFDDSKTRYNLQGAQDESVRQLHATGILTIQLILDAKAKNLKTFDFWGIAPDNASQNHPWAGFTSFKKSFDGTAAHYCGTWDIPLATVKYVLYKFIRKINRLIRKI